jgi:type VI secretion system protein VasJ
MSEELIAASKERVAELLQPINGGPGEDVSYDDKFEALKAETEKIASLTGEKPNWGEVSTLSDELLRDKSKDFRLACYLATCMCLDQKLEPVLDALMLLRGITETFWEDMFPPLRRIRARAGMVGWFSDQAGPVVQEIKLTAKDGPLVEVIEAESAALDTLFREKFADHYTGLSKLRDAARHLKSTCPKEKPKPEPKPAAAAPAGNQSVRPPPPVVHAAAAPAADVSTVDAAERALEPQGRALLNLARSFRSLKPEHNMAYRLARMGLWLDFLSAPPAEGGRTLVPPPPAGVKDRLDSLVSSNDFLALLNEAEDAAAEFPCWLDPHRYTATAMSALGALFMKAKGEVIEGVALFLRRVPSMNKLTFSDGTPFADGQTAMWLEQEVAAALGSGDGGGGGGAVASALDEPLKEARELAVKGELGKALAVVAGAAQGAPTPVERFRGQLAMAQLCLGAGHYAIARSQLEGLTGQIQQHVLTTWDPALCADVYAALFTSIKSMNDTLRPKNDAPMHPDAPTVSPADEAAEQAAFRELCRLDPSIALKLTS